MFEYYICNTADDGIFKKQCTAIENKLKPLLKERLLEDVDGTLIQMYSYGGNRIKVCSDHALDEVYVKSEIELNQFFA